MTTRAVLAFALVFGLPLWLVIEEFAHRTRAWRAAPGQAQAAVNAAARPSPRRAP
jgi:hypothetical protein